VERSGGDGDLGWPDSLYSLGLLHILGQAESNTGPEGLRAVIKLNDINSVTNKLGPNRWPIFRFWIFWFGSVFGHG
jgi:hypothetical protein